MRTLFALIAVVLGVVGLVGPAQADPLPWPAPASPPLPPDLTVPYLPAVAPVICPGGELDCFQQLEAELTTRTTALGCDHDAIFSDAYVTITRALMDASSTPGYFDRPDRVIPTRQYGTESRLGWVVGIANLPSQTTLQNYGSEKIATIVSHQHPDHD